MLSRVADSLYWMSRYLERAEHTARLLDLNLHQMLDQSPEAAGPRWERLLLSLRAPAILGASPPDAYRITDALTFDQSNGPSIIACVSQARENARQVREQISSEMWEQLNRLTLRVKGTGMEEIWHTEPHEFFQSVKDGAHLFLGITDATMSHGEGWQFIQLGRFIERAGATAALLDIYLPPHIEQQRASAAQLDYLGLVGVLKSCTAFEAYCQVYTAHVQPQSIAEFLLLNAECPRSVRFAVESVQAALQNVSRLTGVRKAGRAERLAGRLRASLEYGQVDEIIAGNLGAFLEDIQRRCNQLHAAIHQTYIAYPIDTALAS
jgi:uncharacterized alpha-E superfamily protein